MRSLSIAIALVACACSTKTDGPEPAIQTVAPSPVCTAQADTVVSITGSGFSPIVGDALTSSPSVVMPQVFLDPPSGQPIEIPQANIATPDATGMRLDITIPAGLVAPAAAGEPAVSYSVRVRNPTGNEASAADALVIVPPPDLLSIDPTSGAIGRQAAITLTGTGFLPDMTVTLGSSPPVTATGVTVAADGTSATATFDLTGVAAGTYDVTVANVAGCSDTLAGAFTVYETHDFTIVGIDPPFGCACEPTSVTISSAAGFVSTPRVELRPAGQSGSVTLMTRVAFLDASTITAVVPAGLDLGLYDITVINPPSDGGVGSLPNGFRVVALPIARIEAIVPDRGSSLSNTPVVIHGENFRDPVKLELIDRSGNVDGVVASVTPTSATRIDTTFPTMNMTEDAYLVRVTNLDENTYSTYSSFVVGESGPSGNLHPFTAMPLLNQGRRMLGGAMARDDLGNTFVYAIAGDTGSTGTVLDTVEVSQLSKFGDLSPWRAIRAPNKLTTPRQAPAAVTVPIFDPAGSPFVPVKTYVYVTGGRNAGATVLGTVERAMVLRNADAPVVTSIAASTTPGTLAAGTWYYKVSAVLASSDPDNPGGETLPSDEAIITIGGANTSVDLAWNAVVANGTPAASYRIYRTAMVDGASQQELLIASVTDTSYTDTGASAGTEAPLPPGSLGVWRVQTATHGVRWGHQAAVIADSTGARFLHVLGGKSDATTGYLATIEVAPLDSAGQLGSFGTTGTTALPSSRAFFQLVIETVGNVSGYPGTARMYCIGGAGTPGIGGNGALDLLQYSDVGDTGTNGAWSTFSDGLTLQRAGAFAVLASEKIWVLGGAGMTTNTSFATLRTNGEDIGFDSAGDLAGPIQATGEAFPSGQARALGATVAGSGFIYFIAGSSDGSNATNTVYQTF